MNDDSYIIVGQYRMMKINEGGIKVKLYKKLFAYMPERKLHGYLAVILTTVGLFVQFIAYYKIWLLLRNVFINQSLEGEMQQSLIILLLFISHGLLYLGGTWFAHLAGFRLETKLRELGVKHLLEASNTFFDTHDSGEVRKIIDNNVEQTHMIVAHLISDQTAAFLTPLLMLVLIFSLDIYLGLFFVAIIILTMIVMKFMMGDMSFMEAYMQKGDELNAGAVEYVRGMPVVKIFNTPLFGFKKLYENIIGYRDMVYKYSMSCRVPYVSFQWLLNIFIVAPLFLAIWMVMQGEDAGLWSAKILFFTLFMGIFYSNMMRIMYVFMYSFQAEKAVDNLEALFQEMKEKKVIFGNDTEMTGTDIVFKHVDFSYEKNQPVLSDFSLELEGNKIYALVGASGSGKSTIGRLVSGLYPVDAGEIMIGGKPVTSYDRDYLMRQIGVVFQHPKLFSGLSIFENVRLAKTDATDEEVLVALKQARCESLAANFQDGYNAVIGADGINLSGGEIQRISCARVFLKNPQIIILDEASAAADPENEYELQLTLAELIKGRTTIMIAHRLSSVRGVDEILLVDHGQVVERGSHQELMSRDGQYKKFVNLFDSANEWRVKE